MKKMLAILAVLWAGGAAGLWYWAEGRHGRVAFKTAAVRRGDLRTSVLATGTIEPEEVVDVGAQVAGEIQSFGPDPRDPKQPVSYGSPVEQGTVLAKLDDALFKARVAQARAQLAKAEADVEQAQAKFRQAERDLNRQRRLHARADGVATVQDLDTAQANFDAARAGLAVARSAVEIAQANLDEATVNLGYTTIRSPVKGVVLDRRVNIGQTVVASLNAPSLFLIAKDLRRLEIWASVNETDIGAIRPGQPVRFTVGAFPKESFTGRVGQVRLNASMVQNVVTYTVVVQVDNASGRLLPYLTARLEFDVAGRTGVLLVPNAALRWKPRPEHVAPEDRAALGRDARKGRAEGTSDAAEGIVWVRRGEFARPVRVRTGLSDGASTEVRGDLREGDAVVVGVERRDETDEVYSILPHTQTKKK